MAAISIGDIMATIALAFETVQILANSRHAPAEYQALAHELASFRSTLNEVMNIIQAHQSLCSRISHTYQALVPGRQSIEVDPFPGQLFTNIESTLERCNAYLNVFHNKIQSYDKYLDKNTSGNRLIAAWKRICWAALKRKQVMKLKNKLSHERSSLNLMISSLQLSSSDRIGEMLIHHLTILNETQRRTQQLYFRIGPPDEYEVVWLIDISSHRIPLPFELCSTWQTFKEVLTSYIRNKAGSQLVARGDFELMVEESEEIISPATWQSQVKPNTVIGMNIVLRMKSNEHSGRKCPACKKSCGSNGNETGAMKCCYCGTLIRTSNQGSQRREGGDHSQHPVELISEARQEEIKQLRRFRIINMVMPRKRNTLNAAFNMEIYQGRRCSRPPEVVLTIPSKYSWMVSSEIRHTMYRRRSIGSTGSSPTCPGSSSA